METKNSSQKTSFQKIPPKKILPKNFSQNIFPKKFLQKIPPKNSQKILNTIPPKNQKICKQFFKKFLRFWKYPIPYIGLRSWKPFRALFIFLSNFHLVSEKLKNLCIKELKSYFFRLESLRKTVDVSRSAHM